MIHCKNRMDNIFIQRHCVISSFIVPWIMGFGCKTPQQAKTYIKYGESLNPLYYPCNQNSIIVEGEECVYTKFMKRLFHEDNINYDLTQFVGENVYEPWDCLSGIYQIEINEKMGLVARPNGITKNNECVVMVDDYLTTYYNEEELSIKLLSTMAVWKAKRGLYIIKKMGTHISLDFDNSEWENTLSKIKLWAESI